MKRAFIIFTLLMASAALLGAQNALSIMTSAKNRVPAQTIQSQIRAVITARNGTTSEMALRQFSKDGPNGARTMIEFLRPATYQGNRVLNMETASGSTVITVYIRSQNRMRQLPNNEKSSSFIGDFSYDDISFMDRNVSLDTHSLLREETLNGRACYVIQSVPTDSSWQYSKTVSWIDKTSFLIYKTEMYNRNGVLQKVMEMSNFQDRQGRITPLQINLATAGAGSTTIYMEIRYDDDIPEGVFTTRFLETGRY